MKKYILLDNESLDGAYHRIAGEVGLYGVAVFGHRATKKQRAKLAYIHKSLLQQYLKREINPTKGE